MKTKNSILTAALTFAVFAVHANHPLCIDGKRWGTNARFLGIENGNPAITKDEDAAPHVELEYLRSEKGDPIRYGDQTNGPKGVRIKVKGAGYLAHKINKLSDCPYFTEEKNKNEDATVIWLEEPGKDGHASKFYIFPKMLGSKPLLEMLDHPKIVETEGEAQISKETVASTTASGTETE